MVWWEQLASAVRLLAEHTNLAVLFSFIDLNSMSRYETSCGEGDAGDLLHQNFNSK